MNNAHRRVAVAIGAALLFAAAAAAACDKPKVDKQAHVARNPSCLTQTGSRIPAKGAECLARGHSLTGDEIRRTGANTVGQALQLLDPTIHH
jgi:hypothetical protein